MASAIDLDSIFGGGAQLRPITEPTGLVSREWLDERHTGVTPLSSFSISSDRERAPEQPRYGYGPNGSIDYGWTSNSGGVTSSYGFNSRVVFPSLAGGQDDYERRARKYMKQLEAINTQHINALSVTNPSKAGRLLADLDSMKSGYEEMLSSGEWSNPLEAAHAVGVAKDVFDGCGNLARNTSYLKRFADTRGVKMADAGSEMSTYRKAFAEAFLTAAGFSSKVTPDQAVFESISDDFSDFLGGMMSIEDHHRWQFDRRTYEDSVRKAGAQAGKLFMSGASMRDIGGEEAAKYMLLQNGALTPGGYNGTSETNRLARLDALHSADVRRLSSLYGNDSVMNPNSAGPGATEPTSGVYASIAGDLYRHRVRMLRSGRDPNDFSDTSELRSAISQTMKMFSTGASNVDDRDIDRISDGIIFGIRNGGTVKVDIPGIAASVAGALPRERAAALASMVRSMVVDDPETQRTIDMCVAPFVSQFTAMGNFSANDPTVRMLTARLYQAARRRILDVTSSSEADGVQITPDDLQRTLEEEFKALKPRFEQITAAQNARIAEQAQARSGD